MNKHTPGPWVVNRTITAGNQSSQFQIIGTRDGSLSLVCYGVDTGYNEIDANANLISAAPDLLEVAKLAIDLDSSEDMDALFHMANKAIAKAQGES